MSPHPCAQGLQTTVRKMPFECAVSIVVVLIFFCFKYIDPPPWGWGMSGPWNHLVWPCQSIFRQDSKFIKSWSCFYSNTNLYQVRYIWRTSNEHYRTEGHMNTCFLSTVCQYCGDLEDSRCQGSCECIHSNKNVNSVAKLQLGQIFKVNNSFYGL